MKKLTGSALIFVGIGLCVALMAYVIYSINQTAGFVGAAFGNNDEQIKSCISSGGQPVIMYGFKFEGCSMASRK